MVPRTDRSSSSRIHNGLYWFLTITTAMSGGLGFLCKLDGFYHPDAYLVYNDRGQLTPGRGTTPFEVCATYVIAVAYLAPLVGMTYAKWWTTSSSTAAAAAAARSAGLFPFVYHAAMIPGVLYIFPHALNPSKASLPAAAAMHVVYAALFFWYIVTADDQDGRGEQEEKKVKTAAPTLPPVKRD
jgi:hypothetical protein